MMDLSREAAKYPPYHPDHPEGLLDITSSINTLMLDEMSGYVGKLPRRETQGERELCFFGMHQTWSSR